MVTGYLIRNGTLKVLHNIVVNNKYNDLMLRNCSTFLVLVCRELQYHGLQRRQVTFCSVFSSDYSIICNNFMHYIGSSTCWQRKMILRIIKFLLQRGQGYDGIQSQALAAVSFLLFGRSIKLARKACTFYLGLIS